MSSGLVSKSENLDETVSASIVLLDLEKFLSRRVLSVYVSNISVLECLFHQCHRTLMIFDNLISGNYIISVTLIYISLILSECVYLV